MPFQTHETTISGVKYSMEQLGAVKGRLVSVRLVPALLRGISSAMGNMSGGKGLEGLNYRDLGQLLGGGAAFLEELGADNVAFIADAFSEKSHVWVVAQDGVARPIPMQNQYDTHFAGRWEEHWLWMVWGIQVNRFLGSLGDRLAALSAAAPPSTSPQGSTGISGGPSSPNG